MGGVVPSVQWLNISPDSGRHWNTSSLEPLGASSDLSQPCSCHKGVFFSRCAPNFKHDPKLSDLLAHLWCLCEFTNFKDLRCTFSGSKTAEKVNFSKLTFGPTSKITFGPTWRHQNLNKWVQRLILERNCFTQKCWRMATGPMFVTTKKACLFVLKLTLNKPPLSWPKR